MTVDDKSLANFSDFSTLLPIQASLALSSPYSSQKQNFGNERHFLDSTLHDEDWKALQEKYPYCFILLTGLLGEIFDVTRNCEEVMGYTAEELVGRAVTGDLCHPDDISTCYAAISDVVLRRKSPVSLLYRLTTKAGECIPILSELHIVLKNDQPKCILHICQVAAMSPVEDKLPPASADALSVDTQLLEELLQSKFSARLTIEGEFSWVSAASINIVGYVPIELLGKNIYSLLREESIGMLNAKHVKLCTCTLERNTEHVNDIVFIQKDGTDIFCDIEMEMIYDDKTAICDHIRIEIKWSDRNDTSIPSQESIAELLSSTSLLSLDNFSNDANEIVPDFKFITQKSTDESSAILADSLPSLAPFSLDALNLLSGSNLNNISNQSPFQSSSLSALQQPPNPYFAPNISESDILQSFSNTSRHSSLPSRTPILPMTSNWRYPSLSFDASAYRNKPNCRYRKKSVYRPSKRADLQCEFCETRESPEWRRGPSGSNALCNACGIKYAKKKKTVKTTSEKIERSTFFSSPTQNIFSSLN